MSISKSKIWLAGGVVLCVLLLVASWFLLIQPKRAEAADLRDQTVSTQQNNEQTRAKIAQLKAQFATLPAKKAELAKVREAMPPEYAESTLQRALQKLATGTGTTFVSIANGEATPFVTQPTAAAATPSASAAGTADDAAAPAPATAAGSVATVKSMQVTLTVQSTFAGSQAFLQKLQDQMPRAYLVTGLNITAKQAGPAANGRPATKNGDVEMVITGLVFLLQVPEEADVTTAATPAATVATPTATATAGSGSAPAAPPVAGTPTASATSAAN